MRVKRYVVDSMPDALQKIRTDLGKDAVILNTKEIRTGGFLGMFGKKKIEVIAAIDGGAGQVAASPTAPKYQPAKSPIMAASQAPVKETYHSDFPEVPDVLVSAAATAPSRQLVTTAASAAPPSISSARQSYTSNSNLTVEAGGKPNDDKLLEEIKQMKEMMKKLAVAGASEELPECLQVIEQKLLYQEVDPQLVKQMIDQVLLDAEEKQLELISEEFAETSIRRQIASILHTGNNKRILSNTRVVHFVGPTGVGKTTTIAKLAAEQVLKYQKKVGFITSDTYRIAAIEQLKTYATILNIPLEIVFSPQDLSRAFHNLEGCDVIFMDTAGRNFRNEMYVSELNALLKTQGNSETILVLSMTTKYRDMKAITNNFNKFKVDKVLFTKLDETDSFGAIVNLINEFSLQLSYVTNGQSVPDDISEMNENEIIDLLLEEPKS
ncbi:flagellar biosynthesis protein FlhF [Paenibacillus hexagrammi]|uniref:Flagellar biosynthesis protein FlhF n=1 Tax=Paenibacillus hexagrammi TaxID=2908839 RepID=A0ABY3SPA2_9BACL|nr:flagellar biosynthesis protein FlhF [Paenibacillus sp. YPD9-1]UJF35360.1 flagellar biosynthesis protein FlhF [Paenibacillus sp. YPD9-1]